jgi:hypothetical protein
MIRKFDPEQDILVYVHVVVDLATKIGEDNQSFFMLGILSNDDIRARSTLAAIFDIPPVFHRRSEVRLVEKRWRNDAGALLTRFSANVYSVLAASRKTGDKLFTRNVTPSPHIFGKIKENVGKWW